MKQFPKILIVPDPRLSDLGLVVSALAKRSTNLLQLKHPGIPSFNFLIHQWSNEKARVPVSLQQDLGMAYSSPQFSAGQREYTGLSGVIYLQPGDRKMVSLIANQKEKTPDLIRSIRLPYVTEIFGDSNPDISLSEESWKTIIKGLTTSPIGKSPLEETLNEFGSLYRLKVTVACEENVGRSPAISEALNRFTTGQLDYILTCSSTAFGKRAPTEKYGSGIHPIIHLCIRDNDGIFYNMDNRHSTFLDADGHTDVLLMATPLINEKKRRSRIVADRARFLALFDRVLVLPLEDPYEADNNLTIGQRIGVMNNYLSEEYIPVAYQTLSLIYRSRVSSGKFSLTLPVGDSEHINVL